MEILKKLINKYMPSSLGILIALVIMTSITSCEGCKTSGSEDGVPVLGFDKTTVEAPEYDVEVIVNPNSEKTVDLTATYLEVQVVGVVGGDVANSKLEYKAYDENGNESVIFIKGGESKREPLKHFYKVDDKTILESGDTPLTKKFTFIPEVGKVTEMTASFQIVDKDGNPLNESEKCLVVWKAKVAAPKYRLKLEGVGSDHTVDPAKNNFTIKVVKDGGKIEKTEVGHFKVVATIAGDATINEGNTINFVDTHDFKVDSGIIEKKITVTPGTQNSQVTLKLHYNNNEVLATAQVVKIPTKLFVGAYTLAVDKNKIEDGSTELEITVSGGKELKEADLEKLVLQVAVLQGDVKINGVDEHGKLAFGTDKLAIDNADKKKATKTLTIVPGTDRKAEFTLTLLDEKGNPIPGAEKIVEWGIDARLVLDKFAYNTTDRKITGTIRNIGKIDFPGGDLTWDTQSDEIKIGADKTGKIVVPAIAKGTDHNIDLGSFDITPGGHSKVKLKLIWDKLENKFIEENNVVISEDANVVTVLEEVGIVTAKLGGLDLTLAATPINLAGAVTALKEAHLALEGAKAAEGKIDGSSPLKEKAEQAVKAAEVEYTAKEAAFKAKVAGLVAVQQAEIERIIKKDGTTDAITQAADIDAAQRALAEVGNAAIIAKEIADAITEVDLRPDLKEINVLKKAAEDAFVAKAASLVEAQANRAKDVDVATYISDVGVELENAKNALDEIAAAATEAEQINTAVVKDALKNADFKKHLGAVKQYKTDAEEAFKAKALDLVKAQKGEIEKVITADKAVNTIKEKADLKEAKIELDKVTDALSIAMNAAKIANNLKNSDFEREFKEVVALTMEADIAFVEKAKQIITTNKGGRKKAKKAAKEAAVKVAEEAEGAWDMYNKATDLQDVLKEKVNAIIGLATEAANEYNGAVKDEKEKIDLSRLPAKIS